MKSQKTLAAIAALAGLFLSYGASAATLVPDGDFSNPYGGSAYTTYSFSAGDTFGPWAVTTGSVDLIGGYWQSPTGGLTGSVDLDGNAPGGISQTFSLNPGKYVMTFSLSGNPDGGNALKSLQASIGGSTGDFTYTTGANIKTNMNYAVETLGFSVGGVGPQNVALSFLSLDGSGAYGAVVGNVAISAVPLPPTFLLFAAGLAGLGFFAFYRRRAM
ncbi:MAG: DUF642 domain-containing protein [Alphaproteobacteria bacterium]|nr:DUF642 domain-containing protein [Alphaproteobacteria bacterium]